MAAKTHGQERPASQAIDLNLLHSFYERVEEGGAEGYQLVDGDSSEAAKLLNFDRFTDLLWSSNLRGNSVHLVRNRSKVPAPAQPDGSIDARRLWLAYDSGDSIVLNGAHMHDEKIARACRALSLELGALIQANVYLTPPGSPGLKAHCDDHDVIVVQVSGEKLWAIYPTAEEMIPPQGEIPDPKLEFKLGVGRQLFMKTGVPHSAVSTDHHSLHVTFGIYPIRWRDLLKAWIESSEATELESPVSRNLFKPNAINGDFLDTLKRDGVRMFESANFESQVYKMIYTKMSASKFPVRYVSPDQIRRYINSGGCYVRDRDAYLRTIESSEDNVVVTNHMTEAKFSGGALDCFNIIQSNNEVDLQSLASTSDPDNAYRALHEMLLMGLISPRDSIQADAIATRI